MSLLLSIAWRQSQSARRAVDQVSSRSSSPCSAMVSISRGREQSQIIAFDGPVLIHAWHSDS